MQRRAVLAGLAGIAVAPTVHAQTPVSDDTAGNLATVRRFFDRVYGEHDPDGIDGTVAADYVPTNADYAPGLDAFRARLVDYFARLDRDFATYAFTWDDAIAAGDVVCVRFHFAGATPDGMQAEQPYVNWFELTDGLIRTYF